jgi:hypothetical protein
MHHASITKPAAGNQSVHHAHAVWLRKNFRRDIVKVACTILVPLTEAGQVKIMAHFSGHDAIRYVKPENLEMSK